MSLLRNWGQIGVAIAAGALSICFQFAYAEEEIQKTKADTNREVALTYAQIYLEQKLYDEAETALQLSLKNDGENGTVLNFLGLIQLQRKNFSQACYSFQTASIVFKDVQNRVFALYNLADCLHQGGRHKEAIQVLKDLVKKEEGVSNSAEKSLELLEAGVISPGDPLPAYRKRSRGRLRMSAALTNGFDSNVLLVEEAVATGMAVKDRGSLYTTPTLQTGYMGRVFNLNLDARLTNAYTHYFNSYASSFNNLYNRLDVQFGAGQSRFGIFSDLVMLNLGSFSVYTYDAGLAWQSVRKLNSNQVLVWDFPLRYQKFILNSSTSAENDRTGANLQARLSYRNQWGENDFYLLGATLDNQYTFGRNYRLSGLTIPFTVGLEIPTIKDLGFLNTFTAELSGQLYWQSEVNRRDYSYRLGAGLIRTVFESWNLSLEFSYLRNNSNVDAATYSKGLTSLMITHYFL